MAFRKFKVEWTHKATAFNVLDNIPYGENIYYFMQRYVTRTIPRILSPTNKSGGSQIAHADCFRSEGINLSKSKLFEFGAGWDLYSNIILYCLGVNEQVTIDVRRWAKAEAINAVIFYLQKDPPEGSIRIPQKLIRPAHLEADLLEGYGITYIAPADASALKEPAGSFDLVVTTSVLEHIPVEILGPIMMECRRILKVGGLMRHTVDYSDHYAHADGAINEYNYLKYNDKEWSSFNPSIHYQNRQRRPFYERLFLSSGFEIVSATPWLGSAVDLASIKVNEEFEAIPREKLVELGGHFLLRAV